MTGAVGWLIAEFFAAVALGAWIGRVLEGERWRRLFVQMHTRAPMSTQLPTVAELRSPDWIELP